MTAFYLRGFKGIGMGAEPVIQPLSLLFGPNSAGKSSILQALLYTQDILERHNLDADRTLLGGRSVELGGFRNLLHQHDTARPMELAFELEVSDYDLAGRSEWSILAAKTARVLLRLEWSETFKGPQLTRYQVDLDGREVGHIAASKEGKEVVLNLNPDAVDGTNLPYVPPRLGVLGQASALPRWGLPLSLKFTEELANDLDAAQQVQAAADALFVEVGEILRRQLAGIRYLGPLRDVPPRNYVPGRSPNLSGWAEGLSAWDALHLSGPGLVEEVSEWLSRTDRFNTGYSLRLRRFRELDEEGALMLALRSGRAFDDLDQLDAAIDVLPEREIVVLVDQRTRLEILPQDVGVGLSQVLPVVVAALAPGAGGPEPDLVMIEQPELHVHPAIQVELGDLFIEQAKKGDKRFLIETHSEHLILRLLRRISETYEGDLPPGAPSLTPDDVAVYWVEQGEEGVEVKRLRIDETGEFVDRWPRGFFEERGKELF